jgi:hypothetical protein
MSDNWIVLVPQDPLALVDADRLQRAMQRICEIAPEADETKMTVSKQPQFFDCGANLERITCPSCQQELRVDWFQDRMDADYDGTGFRLNTYRTPCCDRPHSLNELLYEWPAGFGMCSLEVMNPNIGLLSDEQRREIEEIVGLPLRVIYQHY